MWPRTFPENKLFWTQKYSARRDVSVMMELTELHSSPITTRHYSPKLLKFAMDSGRVPWKKLSCKCKTCRFVRLPMESLMVDAKRLELNLKTTSAWNVRYCTTICQYNGLTRTRTQVCQLVESLWQRSFQSISFQIQVIYYIRQGGAAYICEIPIHVKGQQY